MSRKYEPVYESLKSKTLKKSILHLEIELEVGTFQRKTVKFYNGQVSLTGLDAQLAAA